MRAMRQARQQDELEQMRQGVRVPTRDEEEAAASATGKLRQNREESNPPITFEDFYNRTK